MNNTVNSLFSEMQQHQRFQIRQEPMFTHMHEELLLQGMLVGARYGTGVMMQGPHEHPVCRNKGCHPSRYPQDCDDARTEKVCGELQKMAQ